MTLWSLRPLSSSPSITARPSASASTRAPGDPDEALEPIRQAVRGAFGAIGQGVAAGRSIRHDHGSQCMSRDFQKELRFLGATNSPAFVRAPGRQRLPRALHQHAQGEPALVRWFETIENLRQALLDFRRTYNEDGSSSVTHTARQRRSDASRPQPCRRPLTPRSLSQN
jgi:hypothetical protein